MDACSLCGAGGGPGGVEHVLAVGDHVERVARRREVAAGDEGEGGVVVEVADERLDATYFDEASVGLRWQAELEVDEFEVSDQYVEKHPIVRIPKLPTSMPVMYFLHLFAGKRRPNDLEDFLTRTGAEQLLAVIRRVGPGAGDDHAR